MDWAPSLARDLRELWPWLADVPLMWVAATLGAALGRDWTVEALDVWVRAEHGTLLEAPARPARYLKTLLVEVLAGETEPPYPARLAIEARRERVIRQRAQLREHQAAVAAADARRAEAAQLSAVGEAARAAARAIAARRTPEPQVKSTEVPRPRPQTAPGRHLPVAVTPGVACDVSWHGCADDVASYQEPWPGGHVRHYCRACAVSITATW